ncbi:MAG: hypothetical protein IIU85_00220 [Rikenellaceae bacterium]|nr:hypothetical protein [Rikenellaceae bacterium]
MKTRLFRTVVAFLFAGLALTQVGCYDQQIDDLNNRIDELTTGKIASIESQYSSLQTTLSALQSKDAAMETKNAELQAAIATLENSLDGFLTKSQLDATLTSYATVAELGKYALADDVEDAIAAAGEALEESFENAFNAAAAAFAAGEAGNTSLEKSIVAALNAAKAETEKAIAAAVAEGGVISTAVAKQLADANAELAKHISARLTSLQVIPTLFVDGVETVELNSFAYYAKDVNNATEAFDVAADPTTTSSLATTVNYYVSPAQVTTADIDAENVEFLFHEAETTRAAVPAHVASAKIEAGKLSVSLVRTAADAKVNLADGKVWVGAVKVPIAAKHLAEGETDAAVISDYVALKENSVVPMIAAAPYACATAENHYEASYDAAQKTQVVKEAYFDAELNLTAMVTGCDGEAEIKAETLAAAGLKFQFAAPTAKFEVGANKADQQKFIKVYEKNGVWYAKAQLPDGTADNKAALGKTPIVRVELVDTYNNNAIVDVRWFKLVWVDYIPEEKEPLAPIVLEAPVEFEYTLSCAPFAGNVTWDDMITKILAKFEDNKGMSFTDFVEIYTAANATVDAEGKAVTTNTGVVILNKDNQAAPEAPVLVWTATTEQIGTVMDITGKQTVTEKTVLVKFQSADEYTYPSYFVTFKMNIKLPVMPVMNGYRSALWSVDGVLANVYPVQYKPEFAQTYQTETCSYNYDFDQLFVGGQIVKNLLPCGKWAYTWTEEAAEIVKNAVAMKYEGAYQGVVTPTTEGATNVAEAITDEYVKLIENEEHIPVGWGQWVTNYVPTAEAKAILGKTAAMNVMAKINPYNEYKVSTFELNFVEPLKVNATLVEGNFVDKVIGGSKVDCSKAFGLTDFVDYLVAEVTPAEPTEKQQYAAELWKYYGVTDTAWDLKNAVINIVKDANGNEVVDDTLTAETAKMKAEDYFGEDCLTKVGSELIFKNINGADVAKVCKIYVPVTVSHKWGAASAKVAIEIHPAF